MNTADHRQGVADGIALAAAVLRELPHVWAEAFPTGVGQGGEQDAHTRLFVGMLPSYAQWAGKQLATVGKEFPAPTRSPEALDEHMSGKRASYALDMAMVAASIGGRPPAESDD